ncbi:MAG TPA: protein-methionine-sulfoxide reductase heme-binding subunit MsrQ [Geminicoccus sp.]|jgi:sulfoxide reductase heme-binding subunit YedZ|uniref:sulfite oxidase heme-binding subunit YedZ n=1 Tax=Geminicoccus sp. TaxID=2024832 RepID=UPI002E356E49|nr:protein-methionine-sulfoxide reductase heme-binding subunit MsrQ [Geminicoccus sp.]HEX2525165.1 protein-methionine-sulfoxide reductase heme-binding subunit MsrQ [Geminicoccus sp.]
MAKQPTLKLPWLDRSGQLSSLKLATLALVCLPAAWVVWLWATTGLQPRPLEEAIHQSGNWAVRLLLVSLCISPLRRILNWPRLMLVRRTIGVAALVYALVHLLLYVADQNLDLGKVASEIILRFYLTIGFVALLGLTALGVTSTDAMVRRMGRWWPKLHQSVYVLAVLALVHFFIQSKVDVTEPVLLTGFFLFLMGYRLMIRRYEPVVWRLVVLAVASALLCALIEAAWYGLYRGAPAGAVLAANLKFAYSIRSAWWVLATGLGTALLAVIGDLRRSRQKRPGQRAFRAAGPSGARPLSPTG